MDGLAGADVATAGLDFFGVKLPIPYVPCMVYLPTELDDF